MADIIEKLHAREIFDSRGNPTIEVEVTTSLGTYRAGVPSGASTGVHEAVELRDGGKRLMGKGVLKAIENVKGPICSALKGKSVLDQFSIDEIMIKLDGTGNKSHLGANAITGVSIAVCRAGAACEKIPLYQYISKLAKTTPRLPVPSFNVINGGCHAGNKLAIQEFMIFPVGAKSFKEAMTMGAETYQCLKKLIKDTYGIDAINVGDEGGFAPNIKDNEEGFNLVNKAINMAGYTGKIKIAFDSAASEFYKDGKYDLDFKSKDSKDIVSGEQLTDIYCKIIKKFPIISIEDPFAEDDWEPWPRLVERIKIQCIADDLTVTNCERIQKAINSKSADCLLLKVNQIGTIKESIDSARLAVQNGWGIMVSHRSGETEDPFIADLVVGLGCGQIKSGAPCRSERLAKYNQLLRIEEELGEKAVFAGESFRKANPIG